ncbi:hypothetical protein F0562_000768 [Nyssa sinensis]|uniref:Uncharacterized protein n=1 Tax=Nyssa sinensis TaxID=561372 RepID=A0A5J5C2K6_9ASTE|nr:hypothetical protein F0562_000768 [Nyssa sinensis]
MDVSCVNRVACHVWYIHIPSRRNISQGAAANRRERSSGRDHRSLTPVYSLLIKEVKKWLPTRLLMPL